MKIAPIRPDTQSTYRLADYQRGVVIVEVGRRTTAAERGLQPGDVIVKVQQEEVGTPEDVEMQIEAARKQNHNSVLFLIHREGHQLWLPLPTGKDRKPG